MVAVLSFSYGFLSESKDNHMVSLVNQRILAFDLIRKQRKTRVELPTGGHYCTKTARSLRVFGAERQSEQPIHFSNASGRFLSISDEFSGDYGTPMGDYGM